MNPTKVGIDPGSGQPTEPPADIFNRFRGEMKRTFITIDWSKKDRSLKVSWEEHGDKLPDEIKAMLASKILRELRGKLEVDVRLK